MFPYHGFGMMGGFGGFHMLIGGLIGLALLIGLIWLIVVLVRRASGRHMHGMGMHGVPPMGMGGVTPKDIAQMRYAKGEITREEYQALLEDLSK